MARPRRKGRPSSSIVRNSVDISSRLPWWGVLIFTGIAFVGLYFVVPVLLESLAARLEGSPFQGVINMLIGRRVHVLHWLAYAVVIVGIFFALRNYFFSQGPGKFEKGLIGILAKMFGRRIE